MATPPVYRRGGEVSGQRLQEVVERLWAVLAVADEMANVLTLMREVLGEDEEIVIDVIAPILTEWREVRGVD